MKRLALLSLLALPALAADRSQLPAPLAQPAFNLPTPNTARLSNGMTVKVVEDHELPFVWVTLAFQAGSFTDPQGKEGLSDAAIDLMNDAAGDYDGVQIAQALKRLGASVNTSADADGASLSMRALGRNVDATLSIMEAVLKTPHYDAQDWKVLQSQMLANVTGRKSDPNSVAYDVLQSVLFGQDYKARRPSEASLQSITLDDLKNWHKAHLAPAQSILLVGGDTTQAEILPLLEKHFGNWSNEAVALNKPTFPAPPSQTTLTLVDRPGAAQSVILAGRYTGQPTEADHLSFSVANLAIGGLFTSRVNMNLREKNGYTYGARSSVSYDLAGTFWSASAPVATDKTVPALKELLAELANVTGTHPLEAEEINNARASVSASYPLRFESPDYLLSQQSLIWRYGLPEDWVSGYLNRLAQVDANTAQTAWNKRMGGVPFNLVIVGDASRISGDLVSTGLPILRRDSDGHLLNP